MSVLVRYSFVNESGVVLNGSNQVSVLLWADVNGEFSNSRYTWTAKVALYNASSEYSMTQTVLQSSGSGVTVPFILPISWLNGITDDSQKDAFGDFYITLTATCAWEWTSGTLQLSGTYGPYYSSLAMKFPDVQPVISSVTSAEQNESVSSLVSAPVQGVSELLLTATASAQYGASITKYVFGSADNKLVNTYTYTPTLSGAVTVPITVTDSRGLYTTYEYLLNVLEYQKPSLSNISSKRCIEDGTVTGDKTGAYFNAYADLTFSDLDDENTAAIVVQYKQVGDADWGAAITINPSESTTVGGALLDNKYYDVLYTVSDQLFAQTYTDYVSTTEYLFHLTKDGIGIGTMAQEESMAVGWRANFVKGADVTAGLAVVGGIDTDALVVDGTDMSALVGLSTQESTSFSIVSNMFADVTENVILRVGNIVLYRLAGSLYNNGEPPVAGTAYEIATVPSGFYNATTSPFSMGNLNGVPCKTYITTAGACYVYPHTSYQQSVELYAIGLLQAQETT